MKNRRGWARTALSLCLCLAVLMQAGIALAQEKDSLTIEGGDGVTLTYWIPMENPLPQYYTTLAEHPYFIWLKEQTGVTVEFIHPTFEQMEQQLNLMIASGKFYDMLYWPEYPGGPQAAIDEGCYIDLNPYLDEYMPDYKRALHCADGSIADWEWGPERALYEPEAQPAFIDTMLTSDGSLWGVTQIFPNAYPCDAGALIRKDWLDEAGLQVPETLEELEVVLEAFKQRGPDVVPMSLDSRGYNATTGFIISAFGINGGWFTLQEDGQTIAPYAYTDPAFKEYLTLMNRWYAAGYVDPDFMNRDGDSINALLMSDRLGIMPDSYLGPDYWNEMRDDQSGFELVAMPLPRKTKDQQLNFRFTYLSSPINYTVVTTSCEHPEIAAQWLNIGFTKEGVLRHTYGIEGETYELRDGVPYYTEGFYNHDYDDILTRLLVELWANGSGYNSQRAEIFRYSIDSVDTLSDRTQAQRIWSQNAKPVINLPYIIFEGDGWGIVNDQFVEAGTYADPMVLKYIIGTESLDSFDDFVATAKAMGYDGARDMMQQAFDRMNAH